MSSRRRRRRVIGEQMRIPTNFVIYGFWIAASILAAVSIGGALHLGLRGKGTLLDWRIAKLCSGLLGVSGIAMLLLSFESATRKMVVENGKDYAYAEFLDLKFFVMSTLTLACAKDQTIEQNRLTCFDYENIDRQMSSYWVRHSLPIGKIVNWQRNPEIEQFVMEVNGRLERINHALPPLGENREIVPGDTRITLSMIAVILVIAAVAGAVGDAAFQVRLALDERRVKAN